MISTRRTLNKLALLLGVVLTSVSFASAQSGSFSIPVYYNGTNVGTVSGPYNSTSSACGPNGGTYTVTTYNLEAWSIGGNPSPIGGGGSLQGAIVLASFTGNGANCPQTGWQTNAGAKFNFTNGYSQCGPTYWDTAYVLFEHNAPTLSGAYFNLGGVPSQPCTGH